MHDLRPASLVSLLPSLVGGCWYACGDLEPVERAEVFPVPWEELAAALDPDGTLSEQACAELCTDHAPADRVTEVHLCERELDTSDGGRPAPVDTADTGRSDPNLYCEYTDEPVCRGGRHHASIASASQGVSASATIQWLEGTTHAEASSVQAFVALAAELEAHGAPEALVRRCRAAAGDEVAHARVLGGIARARGGHPPALRFRALPARSLQDVAIENAVEGCVHEVWAAAVAYWQAAHAGDDAIRTAMAPIAADEARHGDLALAIHQWAMDQLDDNARQQVLRARDEAVRSLLDGLGASPDPSLVSAVGLPDRPTAQRLARQLLVHVWAADA